MMIGAVVTGAAANIYLSVYKLPGIVLITFIHDGPEAQRGGTTCLLVYSVAWNYDSNPGHWTQTPFS